MAIRKIKLSYGFACWNCHNIVLSEESRKGIWTYKGQMFCSQGCALAYKHHQDKVVADINYARAEAETYLDSFKEPRIGG